MSAISQLFLTKEGSYLGSTTTISERSSITSACLGGAGGQRQNDETADALEGAGGSKPKC